MIRERPQLRGEMTVDESIPWTVGLYIAEGHSDRGHVKFTIAADEVDEFIMRIEKAASIVGGSVSATRRTKGSAADIIVIGPAFSALMQQFAVGSDCYGKHLSKYSWRQGEDFIALLLKGYLDGDGHPEQRDGRLQDKWILGFTGENFALADDLRCMSAVLGLRHSIRRGTATCRGKEFPTYTGWVSFEQPAYNGKNLEAVEDIGVVNQKSVLYDIEVEDPHLFMLPNGIVSHNSKVDATLSATRSSGIFTQDMEDIQSAETDEKKPAHTSKQAQVLVSDDQRKELFKVADAHGWTKPVLAKWLLGQYGFKTTAEIPLSKFDEIKIRLADQSPKSEKQEPKHSAEESAPDVITKDQVKLFWAVVKKQGWTEEEVHTILKTLGIEHVHLMSKAQLDDVLKHFSKPNAAETKVGADEQRGLGDW